MSGPLTLGVQAPASHKDLVHFGSQGREEKRPQTPKMAGSATTDAQLNAPPPGPVSVPDWVAFGPVPLIG